MVKYMDSPQSRTNRIKKKKKNGTSPAQFKISADARQERLETIQRLLPREQSQIECRDAEFARFLTDQYREYCPRLRNQYDGLPGDVLDDCIGWINKFHGVNKKTTDPFDVDKRFDIQEGRSWVDQRRSKKIVPLFLFWLDMIADAVNHMRTVRSNLPPDLLTIIVEKLLTTTYHPKSSQSNQTALVCMQSLHTTPMRRALNGIGVVVPESKKNLNAFISALREKVENRRLSLPVGGCDEPIVTPDSSDCESEDAPSLVSVTSSLDTVIAQRDEYKMKFEDLLVKYNDLLARFEAMEERQPAVPPQQQWTQNFSVETQGYFLPPPVVGLYGHWEGLPPPPSSPEAYLPSVESSSVSVQCDGDGDVPVMDVNDVPLCLPADALGFLNYEALGY